MFRVLEVKEGGPAVVDEGTSLVGPPPAGTLRWIDLRRQGGEHLDLLRERFGFHPLTIEDCLHFDQRPKLEEYGEYLFVVTHGFTCPSGDPTKVEVQEVHAFLGAGYLVTVHDEPIAALDAVWKRAAGDAPLVRRGIDFVYYLFVDALVDANFPILDQLAESFEQIEEAVLARVDRRDLARIFALKQTLVSMRRVLSPERDVFAMLAKRGDARVSERTALYFRDVYDHLVRIYESIDSGRDLLGNALDAYLSMVANRTNDIMKRLTILSSIFLPLAFVTGFFGQNFTHLPFDSDGLLVGMLVACLVIPGGMLFWFWKSEWL